VTSKPTRTFFALALLASAAFVAVPASADSTQHPTMKHHVPSHKTTRHMHTTAAHGPTHHPAHVVVSHHTAPKKPVEHTLN
jgi:Spy/CpxP family protein refolding chaperone